MKTLEKLQAQKPYDRHYGQDHGTRGTDTHWSGALYDDVERQKMQQQKSLL